eukprot:COSAG01_NODE_7597_length_3113_cov_5.019776_4_plen_75_part_01
MPLEPADPPRGTDPSDRGELSASSSELLLLLLLAAAALLAALLDAPDGMLLRVQAHPIRKRPQHVLTWELRHVTG